MNTRRHLGDNDVLKLVTDAFAKINWKVEVQPQVGLVQPDLIAWSPDRSEMRVFELKAGPSPIHTGVLGQLNIFQQAVKSRFPDVDVRSALITTSPVDEQLKSLAGTLDLGIFSVGGADSIATDLTAFLSTPGRSSRDNKE
jgi:hypothetical protein